MKSLRSKNVFTKNTFCPAVIRYDQGRIAEIGDYDHVESSDDAIDVGDLMVLPGLVDTHVHINEPGRTDWEGFATATQAAAAGGITTLVDMPLNCIPATTSVGALKEKIAALNGQLFVDCGFWGGATAENLDELPKLLSAGVLGVKSFLVESGVAEFSHISLEHAEKVMPLLRDAGLPYLFHAEIDPRLPDTQKQCESYREFESTRPETWEVTAIESLIELSRRTGCHVHIVHLSAASVLPKIAQAKKDGVAISVETCPHYLCFALEEIDEQDRHERSLYKCCPPIRTRNNRDMLWQGLKDGVIDFVVSDHSPCTLELKCFGEANLENAWGGIMGLQSSFLAVVNEAEKRGIPLASVVPWFSSSPAKFVSLNRRKGAIERGMDADFFVYDPKEQTTLAEADLRQKNKASPYCGTTLTGAVKQTYLRGELVFQSDRDFGDSIGKTIGVNFEN